MQEPIVFVTVTIKGGYSLVVNLNHIRFISGNHISIAGNFGYDLTDDSARSLKEIIDMHCWTHDCRG